MKVLILGASGATGKHAVQELLKLNCELTLVIRPSANLPESWKTNSAIEIIKKNVSEIDSDSMAPYLKNCACVISCLGHNLNFKGIYGKPRRLVKDAIRLVCESINKNKPHTPVKVVLMNTTGNRNRDLEEPISILQKIILGIIRFTIPPHKDNEQAADYLRTQIGQNHKSITWVAVRPDGLIDQEKVSKYEIHPSPTRSAIFNPGKTSRINVGHFMAQLATQDELWRQWKGKMPVIYNTEK